MQLDQLTEARKTGGPHEDGDQSRPFLLDIVIDQDAGSVIVYDPRAFEPARRAFCRRLVEAALRQPGVRKAEIQLDAASCRLDFDPSSAAQDRMADAFSNAVREAIAEPQGSWWPRWSRPSPRWSALTAYRTDGADSLWETLESRPGRLRLRHPSLSADRARLSRLADSLSALDAVEDCRASSWSRTLTIEYRPDGPLSDRLLDLVEQVLEEWMTAGTMPHEDTGVDRREGVDGPVELATGPRRMMYLAMAGGSFAMTLVGLVVPGIPTVPFLLTTSYYLARSSRRLDEQLRHAPLFGPILVEWERRHGLSRSSKLKLMGLTATIIVVTVALTPISTVALVAIVLISSMSLMGIARLPGLPEEAHHAGSIGRPIVHALPAP